MPGNFLLKIPSISPRQAPKAGKARRVRLLSECYNICMDTLSGFLNVLLSFLLQLATLIANFIIQFVELILNFLQTIVGMSH